MATIGTPTSFGSTQANVPPAWSASETGIKTGYIREHEGDWWRALQNHDASAGTEPGTGGAPAYWEQKLDVLTSAQMTSLDRIPPVSPAAGSIIVGNADGTYTVSLTGAPEVSSVTAQSALLSLSALITNPDTDEQGEFDETGIFLSKPGAAPEDPPITLHAQFDELAGLSISGATAADPPVRHSLVLHSTSYSASDQFRAKTVAVAADRAKLLMPDIAGTVIDGKVHYRATADLDVNNSANWDVAAGATPANRRGTNIYLYGGKAALGNQLDLILSLNSTFPTGYNANNSRKLGSFHALPVDVGTIASHDLTGYLMGDIIPSSVKCLKHRPESVGFGEGMSELVRTNGQGAAGWWGDIYLLSGTGATSASAFNATIWDTKDWNTAVDDLSAVGKQLFSDWLFQIGALGSPEEVNIYGSQDPVKTGMIGTQLITGGTLTGFTSNRTAWAHASYNQEYELEIDGNGTPDTFKWRKKTFGGAFSGYTATVPIVAGAMAIADGLTVTFPSTTGLTIGHKVNIYCMDAPYSTAGVTMISHVGLIACTGNLWQWLQDQSYQFAAAASHTHQVTVSGDPQIVTSGVPVDVAPAISYTNLPGAKGSMYRQGTYGDVKLLAGATWSDGTACGSQSIRADIPRWGAYSIIGARGCAREPYNVRRRQEHVAMKWLRVICAAGDLLAGGNWNNGSNCRSQSRNANNYRW